MSEEIRNKMYDFSMDPPAGTWGNIASMLEVMEEDQRVSEKINSLSVIPPASAWENIQNQLEAPILTIQRGRSSFFLRRMAVAAVLTGLIALSVIFISKNKPSPGIATTEKNNANTTGIPTGENGVASAGIASPGQEQINTGQTDGSSISATSASSPVKKYLSGDRLKTSELASSNRSGAEEKLHQVSLSQSEDPALYAAVDNTDRYYNLMDENGNIVRVSKKLVSLDCVLKNGLLVPIDEKDKNNNSDCQEKVKEWYKLMNQSPAINSPLDLLDIISTGG